MVIRIYDSLFATYKARFEKYPIVKNAAEWIYVTLVTFKSTLRSRNTYRVASFGSSITAFKVLAKASEQAVPNLKYFGPPGHIAQSKSANNYLAPEVRLYKFSDATVIGCTDFVIQGKKLFFDDTFSPKYHVSTLERFSLGRFSNLTKTCRINVLKDETYIDEAINLTSGGAGNFAHFLNENIAKLAILEYRKELHGVPVLVDDCVSQNLVHLLNLVTASSRKIIYVKRFESIRVATLWQISNAGYAPLDVKKDIREFGNFTIFSETAVRYIREILKISAPQDANQNFRKIYLSRANTGEGGFQSNFQRYLVNQSEIEDFLFSQGFEIVKLEKLTFKQLLALTKDASIIVSPIGAALANCILSHPGIKVVALSPFFDGADYTYHSRMVASYGQQYSVVIGQQVGISSKANPNLPFKVELRNLKQALNLS